MKNISIINVSRNTTNAQVRKLANKLIRNKWRKVEIEFQKKYGEMRRMVIIPGLEWNKMNGKGNTTQKGRDAVATKCSHDMITVVEIVDTPKGSPAAYQVRTVNLSTVTKCKVL